MTTLADLTPEERMILGEALSYYCNEIQMGRTPSPPPPYPWNDVCDLAIKLGVY